MTTLRVVCGICGVVQLRGAPRRVIDPKTLDLMTDVMSHRGPNDRGTYLSDGIAIGVRRLSIVDVEGGHQPLSNEDGTIWAAQNGELYNHEALRARLAPEGHVFTNRCDTEVLPHLYERYGPDLVREIRGMFGLVVWDGRERSALIARDRLGIKPLYWAEVGDLLIFASELKSILASGLVEPRVDYEAVDTFLAFGFVAGERSIVAGVNKLRPGHRLRIADGRVKDEPYWKYPRPVPDPSLRDSEAVGDALAEKLEESVRLRLMADVPLGAMLSGGLDSSLVVALMARNMAEPVKTFSIGFIEDGDRNELADARFVSSLFGTEHHEIELSYRDRVLDLETLVWYLDEPLADLSALGFYALCELASKHVTVALSGQGADELFGGYTKHRAASLVAPWRNLPAPGRKAFARVGDWRGEPLSRLATALEAETPAERVLAMSGKVGHELRADLFRGPMAALDGQSALRVVQTLAGDLDGDALGSTLFIDGQLALVDDMLHYFDRSSMAHSLEVRVPFLDHEFVEFAARIPSALKVRRLRTKVVLKDVGRRFLPQRIVDKRKLGFFAGSVGGWLQAQVDDAVGDYLLAENPACADFVDVKVLRRLVEDHVRNRDRGHNARLLLALLMLEVWLQAFASPARLSGGRPRASEAA